MSRAAHEPNAPRSLFRHARWHDWWRCRLCGAVVEDWQLHREWHDALSGPQEPPDGAATLADPDDELGDLVERANTYGNAAGYGGRGTTGHEQARALDFPGGLRQIAAMFGSDFAAARRLVARRRDTSARPAAAPAPASPPTIAGAQGQAAGRAPAPAAVVPAAAVGELAAPGLTHQGAASVAAREETWQRIDGLIPRTTG